jgi:hypothetical protein
MRASDLARFGNGSKPDYRQNQVSKASDPTTGDSSEVPTTPEDMYPTADLRLVMMGLGGLQVKVDRLISNVEKVDKKVDGVNDHVHEIQTSVAVVKGGTWVISLVVGQSSWRLAGI